MFKFLRRTLMIIGILSSCCCCLFKFDFIYLTTFKWHPWMSTSVDPALLVQSPTCAETILTVSRWTRWFSNWACASYRVWSRMTHSSAMWEVALDFPMLENCHHIPAVFTQDSLLPPAWTFSNAYIQAPIFGVNKVITQTWKTSRKIKWRFGKRQLFVDLVKDTPGHQFVAPQWCWHSRHPPTNGCSGDPSLYSKQCIFLIDLKCHLKAHT